MGNKKNEARDIPISFDGEEKLEVDSEDISDKPEEVEPESGKDDQPKSVEATAEEVEAPVEAVEEVDTPQPEELQPDQLAQRRAQINALIAEKASLYDKLLRGQAEVENYGKRVE